jgi:hypothetical protein
MELECYIAELEEDIVAKSLHLRNNVYLARVGR